MLSFLVISLTLINVKSQNYCIWGKQGTNSMVNGEYTLDTDWNGKPSYIKTIGANCPNSANPVPTLYLWSTVANNAWRISDTKGSDSSNMECSRPDLSSCTTNNWGTGNEAVFARSGSCPEWNCERIETTSTWAGCGGPFTQDVGHNIWANSDNSYYWYFVPHMFMWVCNNANQPNICPTSFFGRTAVGWTDLTNPNSLSMEFTDTATTPTTAPINVNCIGTPSPTDATSAPTTPLPTDASATPTPTTTTAAPTRGGPSVCIWGRFHPQNFNVFMNGLYEYDGDSTNGKPTYKKTIDASCGPTLYLYTNIAGNQWRMGTQKGSSTMYGYCDQNELSLCTRGQWYLYNGNAYEVEPNMFYQADQCPFWNCASITSTGGSNDCQSFTQQIGDNTWRNAAGYVWTFNPSYFTWFCIDSNTFPDIHRCNNSFSSAVTPGWTDLTPGASTDLTYTFPAGTGTVRCVGTGTTTTNAPTEVITASPTSPTTTGAPTTTTAQPTTTTAQPTTTTAQPTDANGSAKPTMPPTTTTTKAPTPPTPHPTIAGTARPTSPTTAQPTADGTAKPTSPTTAAPTSQGVTDWTCVAIANTNNYNGNWEQSGTYGGRRAYTLNGNYLYWLDDTANNNGKHWIISGVKGSNSWLNEINAYCEKVDIKECSGEIYIGRGTSAVQDKDSVFSNCGTNTVITTSQPSISSGGDKTTSSSNSDTGGLGGGSNNDSGLDLKWWILIIVLILVCFCCIIIGIICWALLGAKKKKKTQDDDQYADTVQMNQTYESPYDQQQIYQDA